MIYTGLDKQGVDQFVLDISQENDKTKFKMLLWKKNGDKNQRFRFVNKGNGKYQILSSGLAVEVPNNSSAIGVQLLAGPINDTPN